MGDDANGVFRACHFVPAIATSENEKFKGPVSGPFRFRKEFRKIQRWSPANFLISVKERN